MAMEDSSKRSALLQIMGLALIFITVSGFVLGNFYYKSRKVNYQSVEDMCSAAAAAYGEALNKELDLLAARGEAVSLLLGEEAMYGGEESAGFLRLLTEHTEAYLAAAAEPSGKGMDSEGRSIDLCRMDYFVDLQEQRFFYAEDDGITGEKAFIVSLPCIKDGALQGVLYLYVSPDSISGGIPIPEEMQDAFFLAADGRGRVLLQQGDTKGFVRDGNFRKGLENAEYSGKETMESALIKARVYKEGSIRATVDGESYTLFFTASGRNDWRVYIGVNDGRIRQYRQERMEPVKNVITGILFSVGLFAGLLLLLIFLNRYFYNEHKKRLEEKASKDPLTDLSNKASTEYQIKEYIRTHPDSQGLLFVLDVDNFKKINDTLGHAFGDEVLRELGKRLRGEFRITDIVGRIGGDEFIIFLKDMEEESVFFREASRLRQFFNSFQVGEYVKYSPSASIGAAVYPRDGRTFEELYKAADCALYTVKRGGKNQVAFYGNETYVKVE